MSLTLNAGPEIMESKRRMSDETFITFLVMGAAVALFAIASIIVPNFFQFQNMVNLVTNNWAVISLGIGVTFLLVSGNFDLSVGGIVALSGVLSVWFAQSSGGGNPLSTGLGFPYPLAVAGAFAVPNSASHSAAGRTRKASRMAAAMRDACAAGRNAYLAGRIPRKRYANASSPEEGLIEEAGRGA